MIVPPETSLFNLHDFVNVLAGFVLGMLPLIVPMAIDHLRVRRSGVRDKYRGEFHLYHWSGTDSSAVRAKRLRIHLSPSGRLTAVMPRDEITSLSFRGAVNVSPSGIMYLDMAGVGHENRIMIVLNAPITSMFEVTTGVFAAIDLGGVPTAFKAVLSRRVLKAEEVDALIGYRQLLKSPRLPTSTVLDLGSGPQ